MPAPYNPAMNRFDVQVLGTGIVGQSLALALARQGLRVALQPSAAARPMNADVRAYALNANSVDLLRRLRDFASAMLAQAVLGPPSSTALLLAFTLTNPPGERQLAITLSSNDYIALIVGGVLLAVAWIMVEASRIAEEHASFV